MKTQTLVGRRNFSYDSETVFRIICAKQYEDVINYNAGISFQVHLILLL